MEDIKETSPAAEEPETEQEIEDEEDLVEPPPPVRIAVDEWCFHNSMMIGRMDIKDVIQKAADLGVQGVGFDYFMLGKEMRDNPELIKDLLLENGLELVFGFGVPFALPDLVHQVLESRKDEMFDLAHLFGSSVIRVCGGLLIPNMFAKSVHVVVNRDREIKEVSKRLREFTEDAALEGLKIALENHCDYTVDEMVQILDNVDNENFKITLDTGNPVFMKEDPVEVARRLAPFTAYTHIKDVTKQGPLTTGAPLGEGIVDIPSIIGILQDYNYDGLYAIEVDLPIWKVEKEEDALWASVDYLKQFQD